MLAPVPAPPRGVLGGLPDGVRLSRWLPSQDLAPFVEHYWIVGWDLRGREPHVQETLPHPAVHLVVELGGSHIVGVMRARFERRLAGEGVAVATKFRPGGFRPFLGSAVAALTDTVVPVPAVLALDDRALERDVLAPGSDEQRAARLEGALRSVLPDRDPIAEVVGRIVDGIALEPGGTRVEDLAARLGIGVRRLQRLFAAYVGVPPKWVLQRARLHEAAERAAGDPGVDWAGLAADLGYSDQSHLVRDFTTTIGTPPARYAARR
jgi:AraC-like DNA-binding protein